jgi:streptomycin 6-kinase
MSTDSFATFLADTEARLGSHATGWIGSAPALLDELTARWELSIEDPPDDGSDAYTVAALRHGGRPVLLRLTYPDGWFQDEVAALASWNGEGAVELIDHDPRGAQLLARVQPGTSLRDALSGDPLPDAEAEDDAMSIAAGVLERLWITGPASVRTVADEVGEWVRTMPGRHALAGRPFPRELIDEAAAYVRDLLATPAKAVLLHGDLHLGNVRRSTDGHVAVDPKPLVGEREFDASAMIRDTPEALTEARAEGRRRVQHRFDVVADRLGLDRTRLQMWSFVILVDYTLWAFESGHGAFGRTQLAVTELVRKLQV